MSRDRTRPSDIALDLLRSARGRQRRAVSLIAAGALFGFNENTMRVTLSRLMARGLIESPSRGLYRLSQQTDALNDFVERWRLGELRVRAWQPGRWLFAYAHAPRAGDEWVLYSLGFREVRPGLRARPDNLANSLTELRALAVGLGLDDGVLLLAGEPEGQAVPESWVAAWDVDALNDAYREGRQRLESSAARLPRLPVDEACLECFTLGGEMIHRLAKDPLLPAELVDVTARHALWRTMLDYDVRGKEIWAEGRQQRLLHMPRPQLTMAG
jgi:phenylacetic acid degradation operon negative regulatory protein